MASRNVVFALAICTSLWACDDKSSAPATAPSASAKVDEKRAAPPPETAPTGTAAAPKQRVDCKPGASVEFTDPALEAEVRRKLSKDKGPLTPADLKAVRTVNLSGNKGADLDPCVFPLLTGVKDIFLGPSQIVDLSPLSTLVQLESLRASVNKVSDLTPLAKLTKLDRLDLGRTGARDLKPLAGLVNLTELQLDDTEVSDLTPLAACTKMEKLSIKRTQVKDLTPLRAMTKLKFLYIEGTPVEDVSPLGAIKGVKVVR